MKPGTAFREPARVVMHLNEGFTRVQLDLGAQWDIPTAAIPLRLRAIGSRVRVIMQSVRPEPQDSAEALRAAMHDVTVEPLD